MFEFPSKKSKSDTTEILEYTLMAGLVLTAIGIVTIAASHDMETLRSTLQTKYL